MKKFLPSILFYLIFLPNVSLAQTIELYCKGMTSGDFKPEAAEFSINISFTQPNFWGIQNRYVIGCMEISKKPEVKCSAGQNSFDCFCSNSIAITRLNLSRVTGRLTIDSTFVSDKAVSRGVYNCEKIIERKF